MANLLRKKYAWILSKIHSQLYKNTVAFIATILPITFFFFTFSTVTAIFLNVAWNCNKKQIKTEYNSTSFNTERLALIK